MKTRNLLGAAVAAAMLLAMFGGCRENAISPLNRADEPIPCSSLIAPISIRGREIKDFKSAIIGEINVSRSMSREEHQAYSNYEALMISEISEFYFPNVEIDGYKLIAVDVFGGVIIFYYVPLEVEPYHDEFFMDSSSPIVIHVRRQDNDIDVFGVATEQAAREGWGRLTEDGMLYAAKHASIDARMGDTSVRIDVPEKLNSYEYLRDLANQVIKTAELVDVERELRR